MQIGSDRGPARLSLGAIWPLLSTVVPVSMFALFVLVHVSYWYSSGRITGIGFAIQEAILVGLFLIRRQPLESRNTITAWSAAVLGTWGPLMLRPEGTSFLGLDTFYLTLQFLGAALAAIGALYLGRSFGIVAANRGVKTGGAYRLVRHPIYASYIIGFAGYLLSAFSLWNVLVLAVTITFQVRRIFAEESVLIRDPAYQEYASRVRYRLIPGVF